MLMKVCGSNKTIIILLIKTIFSLQHVPFLTVRCVIRRRPLPPPVNAVLSATLLTRPAQSVYVSFLFFSQLYVLPVSVQHSCSSTQSWGGILATIYC